MEPEGSLPHSQASVTCPHPEPDKAYPLLPTILFLDNPFQYYPPIYDWVFEVVSVPHISPPKPHLFPIRATCLANLIILDLNVFPSAPFSQTPYAYVPPSSSLHYLHLIYSLAQCDLRFFEVSTFGQKIIASCYVSMQYGNVR